MRCDAMPCPALPATDGAAWSDPTSCPPSRDGRLSTFRHSSLLSRTSVGAICLTPRSCCVCLVRGAACAGPGRTWHLQSGSGLLLVARSWGHSQPQAEAAKCRGPPTGHFAARDIGHSHHHPRAPETRTCPPPTGGAGPGRARDLHWQSQSSRLAAAWAAATGPGWGEGQLHPASPPAPSRPHRQQPEPRSAGVPVGARSS